MDSKEISRSYADVAAGRSLSTSSINFWSRYQDTSEEEALEIALRESLVSEKVTAIFLLKFLRHI